MHYLWFLFWGGSHHVRIYTCLLSSHFFPENISSAYLDIGWQKWLWIFVSVEAWIPFQVRVLRYIITVTGEVASAGWAASSPGFFFVLFWGRVWSSSDWPWTHLVVQAGLKLTAAGLPRLSWCWDYRHVAQTTRPTWLLGMLLRMHFSSRQGLTGSEPEAGPRLLVSVSWFSGLALWWAFISSSDRWAYSHEW